MKSMGAQLRDATLDIFEDYLPDYLGTARLVARRICKERGSATIDEVRAECPPPSGIDPRVMGAVFHRSQFERIGYENSGRRDCHARPIARFKLKEGV